MRKPLIFLIFILCALPCLAQYTTVSATVTDANGTPYVGGTFNARLNTALGIIPTLTNGNLITLSGQPSVKYDPVNGISGSLDANGSFSVNLIPNASILPASTQWTFTICSMSGVTIGVNGQQTTGPTCFKSSATISGTTQSLTTTLSGAAPNWYYLNVPSVRSTGSSAAAIGNSNAIVQNGLMAEYRALAGETASSLIDYSGNGRTATGTNGTAPTIVSGTGGINCPGNGGITLPSSLNTALTIQVFLSYQSAGQGATFYSSPVIGNSSGSNVGILFDLQTNVPSYAVVGGGSRVTSWGNTIAAVSRNIFQGTGMVTFVMDAADTFYINGKNEAQIYQANTTSAGKQTGASGVFQICGGAANNGAGAQVSWLPSGSIIYEVIFYNRVLTAAEVAQNYQAVLSAKTALGIVASLGNASNTDQFVAEGDSITLGSGSDITVAYPSRVKLNGTWNVANQGIGGYTANGVNSLENTADFAIDPLYPLNAARNVDVFWAGTNDIVQDVSTPAVTAAHIRGAVAARKAQGWKVIVGTMLSRTGSNGNGTYDSQKNTLNTIIRNTWSQWADGLADFAAQPLGGADGASANTTYFASGLTHPTQALVEVDHSPIAQKAINRLYGNRDWGSANTYTTGAPAATAITAASESTNTVTITSTLNPPVGSCVTITGVTPAGYNSPAGACWNVLTTSAGSFTYYNGTTGLGAGSVFGTAAIPLQVDADVYTILGGSAAGNPSFTMESCVGYTNQNLYFKNTNTTSAWVLTPWSSAETIDGATSLTMPTATSGNFPVVILQAQLISASAGGCTWKRLQ